MLLRLVAASFLDRLRDGKILVCNDDIWSAAPRAQVLLHDPDLHSHRKTRTASLLSFLSDLVFTVHLLIEDERKWAD
jgi:hypothetical protein